MMSISKPVTVIWWVAVTCSSTLLRSRSATLTFIPAAGWTTCATTMPTISARVEKNRKQTIALANTRLHAAFGHSDQALRSIAFCHDLFMEKL